MNEETYTISQLARQGIPIGGKHRSYEFIQKLIRDYNIVSPREGIKGHPEYRPSDLEDAYNLYNQVENAGEDEYQKQKLRKLLLENEYQELQNNLLKKTLVSTQEVADFRKVELNLYCAIWRKILFTDVPIEITGLDIPKARTKCEQYYNRLMDQMQSCYQLFIKDYGTEPDQELTKDIEQIIYKVEQSAISGSSGNQPQPPQEDSQPINH